MTDWYDDLPPSFYRAENAWLSPPDNGADDDAKSREQEICEEIEELLVSYADRFCGEISPGMDIDFQELVSATHALKQGITAAVEILACSDEGQR